VVGLFEYGNKSLARIKVGHFLTSSMSECLSFQEAICSTELVILYNSICRAGVVSIVSDCRLEDQGSIAGGGKGLFPYVLCPDQLWGPPSLLSSGV
jgi:hypothetical protein